MFAVTVHYARKETICPWVSREKYNGTHALCSHPERWPLAEAREYVDQHGGSVWNVRGFVKRKVYERPAPDDQRAEPRDG